MEDAFFKTADRSFGFRFHGNPLDRASERREDAAFLAELRARPDARTLLIARDMPILARGDRASRCSLSRRSRRSAAPARGPARPRALGAPVFAALLPDAAVEQRADLSDGFLDKRELSCPAGRSRTRRPALDRLQGLVPPDDAGHSRKPRRSLIGTRAMASAPIAARRRGSPRPVGGANATSARPSISRAPIRS